MEDKGLIENGELTTKEKGSTKTFVNYTRVLPSKRKNNPIKGLANTIKGIKGTIQKKLVMKKPGQKPLPSYGLGAYPPPKAIKPIPIVRPPVKATPYYKKPFQADMAVSGTWKKECLVNNCFFETILMVIIILFLLKWLFGFKGFNY